jgi:hypothetical protein
MRALVIAMVLVWLQVAEAAPATIHGLDIPVPDGWTRTDDPAGAVVLRPGPGPGGAVPEYMLIVLPAQPLRGTLWETHRSIFEELVKTADLQNTVAPIHEANAPGPFIRSSTAGDDANKSIRPLRLYSAPSEAGIECVVVFGSEDLALVGQMLHGARVTKPVKRPPRAKIVEAYRRLKQQADVNVNRGELLVGAVPFERIWLRDDGVADFSAVYPEGYAASSIPPKVDRTLQHGNYGLWKAVGDREVHVVRQASKPAEIYVRENGNLRRGDEVWQPMPLVDGLKLDGRWNLPVPAGQPPRRIEFTAAGRFKDEGVLEDVGHFPVYAWSGSRIVFRERPPARGSGTYEIRDFTLLVEYEDGRVWSTDFSTWGTDPKDLSKIQLRGGTLHREP